VTVDRSPLAGFAERFRTATERSAAGLEIIERLFWHKVNLRTDPTAAASLAPVLRAELPMKPNSVSRSGLGQWLWLGPDEWLLATPEDLGDLEHRLRTAAGDAAISVVDVSGSLTIISLGGPKARQVLAFGCALDLDAAHFGAGTRRPGSRSPMSPSSPRTTNLATSPRQRSS
jgi:sarcosine oxidase, subunit gamma